MTDIVDASTRSRMMSGIKGKDTRQEVEIRKRLFALGFRYRIHDKNLPGKPDIVLRRYKAVIFIHGCFWHAHDCSLFRWPASKKAFWKKKLAGNRKRDIENFESLKKLGWRILLIWECAYRGTGRNREKEFATITAKSVEWLRSKSDYREIRSNAQRFPS
jgi:DNA mismatch endonuclease (patch repair protein)